MGKITLDLGALAGAIAGDKVPKLDDRKFELDDAGNFIDSSTGKIVPDSEVTNYKPYQTPSWATQVFHPEVARQMQAANNAYQLAPNLAQREHDISKGIVAGDIAKVRNSLGTPISGLTDEQAAILSGGNTTSQNLLGVNTAQYAQANGTPQTEADARRAELLRQQQSSNNAYKKLVLADMLGVPGQEAFNESAGLKASTGGFDTTIATEPSRRAALESTLTNEIVRQSRNVPLQLGNDYRLSLGEAATIPFRNSSALDEARTQATVSGAKSGLRDVIAKTAGNQLLGEFANSMNQPPPANPIAARYSIGNNGDLNWSTGVDPRFTPMTQTLNARFGLDGNSSGMTATDANGKPLPVPPSAALKTGSIPVNARPTVIPNAPAQSPNDLKSIPVSAPAKPSRYSLTSGDQLYDSSLGITYGDPVKGVSKPAGYDIDAKAQAIIENKDLSTAQKITLLTSYFEGKYPPRSLNVGAGGIRSYLDQ